MRVQSQILQAERGPESRSCQEILRNEHTHSLFLKDGQPVDQVVGAVAESKLRAKVEAVA
jgi:hypothetical protein